MEEEAQNKLFKDIVEATSETLGKIGYQNTLVLGADQDGKMAYYINGNNNDIAHMIAGLLISVSEETEGILGHVLEDLKNYKLERDIGDN